MWRLLVFAFVASASAQIPSLGWCPDYQPMASFNINRFLGSWYEAERYFTVSELGSRCVTTKYESTPEGRIIVSNEITNFLTGMKRVLDGHLQVIGREGEGRLVVKYNTLPVPYDTEYSVLDTDYDNYAVMWSCSGIGPVHTQNAWILTRNRLANSAIMQQAYATLDRFKISRTFFIKTNQADCTVLPSPAAEPSDERLIIEPIVQLEEKSLNVETTIAPEKSAVEVKAKPVQVPEHVMAVRDLDLDKLEKPAAELAKPEMPEIKDKMDKEPAMPAE